MMLQVSLDTSFLITFSDPERPHHSTALEYFRHFLAQGIPMWISTIAAGEFHVGQAVTDLPLQNFRVQPYNLPHAIRAAELLVAMQPAPRDPADTRRIVINDLKIIAQADEEGIGIIMTEDRNTLTRYAERLRQSGRSQVRTLLLSDGFLPGMLENPDQTEFPLSGGESAVGGEP